MKTPVKFEVSLPRQKDIDEIVDKLLERNPNLLDMNHEMGLSDPRDLCRIVATMYVAGQYVH